jgi:hypothetical protein
MLTRLSAHVRRRAFLPLSLGAVFATALTIMAGTCPGENVTPSFTITFTTPAPASVAPGGTGTVDVTVTRTGGFTGAVAFAFDPNTDDVTGPAVVVAAGQTTGIMQYTVASNANVGSGQIFIDATADGLPTAVLSWNLAVLQNGTFQLQQVTNPGGYVLFPGTSVQDTLAIVRQQFTQAVAFTGTGPTGVTVTFAPSSTTGNLVVATISAAANAPLTAAGSSPQITLTGTSGSQTANAAGLTIAIANDTYVIATASPLAAIAAGATGNATLTATWTKGRDLAVHVTGTAQNGVTVTPLDFHLDAPELTTSLPLPITVPSTTPPGTYTVNVVSSAPGQFDKTSSFTMQVAAASTYTLAAQTAPLSLGAGTSLPDTIAITRSNFTGAVTVTGTSDQGITVSSPAGTTANQVAVTVSVPSTASVGTHVVTLKGVAAGLLDVGGSFAVVVTAPVSNSATWSFCPTTGLPLWVAVQDGTAAWTQVTGSGSAYPFAISSSRGGIAYVVLNGGTTELHIFYGSVTQLQTQGSALCGAATGATRTVAGVVTNPGTGTSSVVVGLGASTAFVAPQGAGTTFSLSAVPPGALDLVAASVDGVLPANPFLMLLQRGVNPASSVGVLDFSTGFTPARATLTLLGAPGQTVKGTYQLHTGTGTLSSYYVSFTGSGGSTLPLFGLAAAQQLAGDLHYVLAETSGGSSNRAAGTVFATIANKQLSFGSELPAPTVTTLATFPYIRPRAVLASVLPEYGKLFTADYQQSSGGTRRSTIQMTGDYIAGATSLTLDVPDFTAVAGWSNSYGLQTNVTTHWFMTGSSWSSSGGIVFMPSLVEGATFTSATRQGDITP